MPKTKPPKLNGTQRKAIQKFHAKVNEMLASKGLSVRKIFFHPVEKKVPKIPPKMIDSLNAKIAGSGLAFHSLQTNLSLCTCTCKDDNTHRPCDECDNLGGCK